MAYFGYLSRKIHWGKLICCALTCNELHFVMKKHDPEGFGITRSEANLDIVTKIIFEVSFQH